MKKGAILLVTLLSLLLVVGCGSSTDQTSIIPAVAVAAPVAAPAAAPVSTVAAVPAVPAGGSIVFTPTTAGNLAPTVAGGTAASTVKLTPGETYTVTVNDGTGTYKYTFTQPAVSGGYSAMEMVGATFTVYQTNTAGELEKTVLPLVKDAATAVSTSTGTKTTATDAEKTAVETTVGDVKAPSFTAAFAHETDVDGDGKYSAGDKFKVTLTINPGEVEGTIGVIVTSKNNPTFNVTGTRTYNSTAGTVTSAVLTTTDLSNVMPHDAAGTYMQSYQQSEAFTMVNTDGTFPHSGTYTYSITVTDKAGNSVKTAATDFIILP